MLTIHNTEAIRRIEAAIGYTFHDKRLLVQVLTRKTYLKIDPEAPDNEVLEFYGDTLMNYHVTNYFMSKYAHMLEDGLFFMRTVEQFTDLRSHYVCNRYLTERVKALGLARYLRAQNREAELRRDSEKAYADIFESLVGAIYLDSYQNDSLIRAFILRQLGIEPKRAPADIEAFDFDTLRDLPEELPEDVLYDESDTALFPIGTASEEIVPAPVTADADEESSAEIIPADTFLTVSIPEMITEPMAEESPAPAEEPALFPITNRDKLSILCEELGFESPTYGETPPNAPNARPVAACTLKYKDTRGKQIKISLNDSGKTLAEATEKAAAKMLIKVGKIAAEIKRTDVDEKSEKPSKSKSPRRNTVAAPPASETQTLAVPAPLAEVTPAVEVVAEAVPVEELSVEVVPTDSHAEVVQTEASPTDTVIPDPAAEAPAEDPLAEIKPSKKSSSTKKNSAKKKSAPADKKTDVAVPEQVATETVQTEDSPDSKVTSKKKSVAKKEGSPAEEQPVAVVPEEIKADASQTENKPVKKASPKKKSATKKAAPVVEDQSADVVPEEIKADVSRTEDKPARKASSKKKSAVKKESAVPASTSEAQ